MAPIYRPYRFGYRFRQNGREQVVQSKKDIRKWMPDHTWFSEPVTAPEWLRPGSAKLDVGVVDPETAEPQVKLAIEQIRDDGWHPMTLVDVM